MKTNAYFYRIGDGNPPRKYVVYTEIEHPDHSDLPNIFRGLIGYVEIVLYRGWSKKITAEQLNAIRVNLNSNAIEPRIHFV